MPTSNGRDRAWLEIDLGAIRHNLRMLRQTVGDSTKIIPVVKADAYGHGAVPVARALADEGVDFFAVATVDEGLQLRDAGLGGSILLLGPTAPERIGEVHEATLTPTVMSLEHAIHYHDALGDRRLGVHLKIDSGMCRMGIRADEVAGACRKLRSLESLEFEGVLSHFAAAADDDEFSENQRQAFEAAVDEAERHLGPFAIRHMSASQALLAYPDAHFDAVRPGNILYGSVADVEADAIPDIRPAMSLKSRLALVKPVRSGELVGYGCTYEVTEPEHIGVVPIGYADGYPRALSNGADVLVDGKRRPVIGRISMDSTIISMGTSKRTAPYEEVVLMGRQGNEHIPAEELAERAGTITQEIFSRMGSRLPRIYRDE